MILAQLIRAFNSFFVDTSLDDLFNCIGVDYFQFILC